MSLETDYYHMSTCIFNAPILSVKKLIFIFICFGAVHSAQVTCLVNNVMIQCVAAVVCPGTEMAVTSTTIQSINNYWKLPTGSCPSKGDTIQLIQGPGASCSGSVETCGPYRAQNSGPDASGRCLTSTLTFVANTTTLIVSGASDSNSNPTDAASSNIMTIAPPGPLTVPNFSTLNETCLTVSWAPPTTGGVPTSYNVSINDSSSPVVIPGNGSSLYTHTFTGLTSNAPYSISVVAINCAGTSNTATVTNYTLAPAPHFVTAQLSAPDAAPYVNISWQGVPGVIDYQLSITEVGTVVPPSLLRVPCSRYSCFWTVQLLGTLQSGHKLSSCVSSYNVMGVAGSQTCYTVSSAYQLVISPWLLPILLLLLSYM